MFAPSLQVLVPEYRQSVREVVPGNATESVEKVRHKEGKPLWRPSQRPRRTNLRLAPPGSEETEILIRCLPCLRGCLFPSSCSAVIPPGSAFIPSKARQPLLAEICRKPSAGTRTVSRGLWGGHPRQIGMAFEPSARNQTHLQKVKIAISRGL